MEGVVTKLEKQWWDEFIRNWLTTVYLGSRYRPTDIEVTWYQAREWRQREGDEVVEREIYIWANRNTLGSASGASSDEPT